MPSIHPRHAVFPTYLHLQPKVTTQPQKPNQTKIRPLTVNAKTIAAISSLFLLPLAAIGLLGYSKTSEQSQDNALEELNKQFNADLCNSALNNVQLFSQTTCNDLLCRIRSLANAITATVTQAIFRFDSDALSLEQKIAGSKWSGIERHLASKSASGALGKTDAKARNLLHLAVMRGAPVSTIAALTKANPGMLNQKDSIGHTPIYYAIDQRLANQAYFLFKNGADLGALTMQDHQKLLTNNLFGYNSLIHADIKLEISKNLESIKNTKQNELRQLLQEKELGSALFKTLNSTFFDCDDESFHLDSEFGHLALKGIFSKYLALFKYTEWILNKIPMNELNKTNQEGETVLDTAIKSQNWSAVSYLLYKREAELFSPVSLTSALNAPLYIRERLVQIFNDQRGYDVDNAAN